MESEWKLTQVLLREGANGEEIDPIPVQAYVSGVLAIHRLPELGEEDIATMRGWTITHVPTGRKLISDELATNSTRNRAERLVGWVYSNIAPGSMVWRVEPDDVHDNTPAFARLLRALQPLAHKLGWKPSPEIEF